MNDPVQELLDTVHLDVDDKAGCGMDVGSWTMITEDPAGVTCDREGCGNEFRLAATTEARGVPAPRLPRGSDRGTDPRGRS